jgi:NADH dehydrogenase [ubiquinone] 1 alpha subcomplex assembly factor 6
MNEPMERQDSCAALVRRYDPDRYFAVLLARADRRDSLFALHAFELELARIPDRVSEPMLGAIRLQWWRESLDGIAAGHPRRHEIVQPLAAAINGGSLDPMPLHAMIDAWDAILSDDGQPDMREIGHRIVNTRGLANRAAMGVLHDGAPQDGTAAADHAAMAVGLTHILLRAPEKVGLGQEVLPREVLARHGLDLGTMLDAQREARLAQAAAEIAALAAGHVEALRAASVPRQLLPALLPASFAAVDLVRLRRSGHDLFDPRLQHRGIGRQLSVLAGALRGRL